MSQQQRFFNNLTHYNKTHDDAPRGNTTLHDYGRGGLSLSNNVRSAVVPADFGGNAKGEVRPMNYIKPDLPTTKKELGTYDAASMPFVQSLFSRPMVYETLDKPKTTLRESMIDAEPPRNLRGTMNAAVPDISVYVPPPTLKQETYVENYVHNATGRIAQELRDAVEGTNIHSGREELAQGRLFSYVGPQKRLGAEDLNVQLHRNVYKDATEDRGRGVLNATQMGSLGAVRPRDTLPAGDRLDPLMISALRTNPYAHSFTR